MPVAAFAPDLAPAPGAAAAPAAAAAPEAAAAPDAQDTLTAATQAEIIRVGQRMEEQQRAIQD